MFLINIILREKNTPNYPKELTDTKTSARATIVSGSNLGLQLTNSGLASPITSFRRKLVPRR
jgi:hypothetical protein